MSANWKIIENSFFFIVIAELKFIFEVSKYTYCTFILCDKYCKCFIIY